MAVYKVALAAPLLVASVSAWGNSIMKNSCGTPVYFWEDKGEYNQPMQTIAPGQSFTKGLYQTGKGNGAGPSYKMAAARPDGSLPAEGDALTQFEYTVDAPLFRGHLSFDISNVNGNGNPPFVAGGISISSPQDSNAHKTCAAGENPCKEFYTAWNDDAATTVTDMNNDVLVDVCGPKPGTMIPSNGSNGGGNNGGNNSPAPSSSPSSSNAAPPPPPPSSSPAPSSAPAPPPQAEEKVANAPANNDQSTQVVWVTEYAPAETVVVHVKREENAQEKREEHIHNHAHAHNKINKRRHGA